MVTKDEEQKRVTLRIPIELWKRLKMAEIEGKIDSINQAALDGMELIINKKENAMINRIMQAGIFFELPSFFLLTIYAVCDIV